MTGAAAARHVFAGAHVFAPVSGRRRRGAALRHRRRPLPADAGRRPADRDPPHRAPLARPGDAAALPRRGARDGARPLAAPAAALLGGAGGEPGFGSAAARRGGRDRRRGRARGADRALAPPARRASGRGLRPARGDRRLRRRAAAGELGGAPCGDAAPRRRGARRRASRRWARSSTLLWREPRQPNAAPRRPPLPPPRLRLGRHAHGLGRDDRRLRAGHDLRPRPAAAGRGGDPLDRRARPARDDRAPAAGLRRRPLRAHRRRLPHALARHLPRPAAPLPRGARAARRLGRRRGTCSPSPPARAGAASSTRSSRAASPTASTPRAPPTRRRRSRIRRCSGTCSRSWGRARTRR